MPEYNLNTLYGILMYSIVTGFFLAIWIHTGIDISPEAQLLKIADAMANAIGTTASFLVPTVTLVLLLGQVIAIWKILEKKIPGIVTAGFGLLGTIVLTLGVQNGSQAGAIIGVILLLPGFIVARYYGSDTDYQYERF